MFLKPKEKCRFAIMTKRQILSFFILIVIFYNTIGFIATFNGLRYNWQCQIQHELASTPYNAFLTVFHFHQSEFPNNTNEFEHNGRWFDVVKTERVGDSLTVYAFDDANETSLVTEFQSLLIEYTTQDSDFFNKTKQLFKNLINEFLFDNMTELGIPSVKIAFLPLYSHIESPINCPFLFIESPPPKS